MLRKYRIYTLTGYSDEHQKLFRKLEEIFSNLIKEGKYYLYMGTRFIEINDELLIDYNNLWRFITSYYGIEDEEFRNLITYMVNNKLGYNYKRCFGVYL